MKRTALSSIPVLIVFLFTGLALAQNPFIYPAKGQSPEQQKRDEFECHQWAVSQTGFDPTKAQAPAAEQESELGSAVRGGVGGALLGLGIGSLSGNAGKGAAIGAGAGALLGGATQAGRNQQAQANYNANLQEYNRAKAVCMEGRGYAVK
jgi:hypothetical protein